MGRRAREERQEKREDYAAKISKNKRKTNLMAVGILALIGVIVGYAIFVFMTQVDTSGALGAPDGAGRLGDEHEHASVLVEFLATNLTFLVQHTKSKVVGSTLRIVMVLLFIDTHQE